MRNTFVIASLTIREVLRRRLQTPLDKLFFREKFDYQAALLEMSEAITGELDLDIAPRWGGT